MTLAAMDADLMTRVTRPLMTCNTGVRSNVHPGSEAGS